jgi:ATP-binding cassette, subfamily B, bacterial
MAAAHSDRAPAVAVDAVPVSLGHVDFRRFGGLVAPYRRDAALVAAGLLVETGFNSLVPYSFKFIIDGGLVLGDHALLARIIAGLAIGAVVVSVVGLGRDYLYARLAADMLRDLRQLMFDKLQLLSMDYFARSRVGDILSRFSGDLAALETAIANAVSWGILPAVDVIANTVLLFVLSWHLALIAMLVWPLCLLGPRLIAPHAVAASYARKNQDGAIIAQLQENVVAQPLVKAFGLEPLTRAGFREHNARLARSVLRVGFFSSMVERSAGIGIMLLQVLVLGVGAWMAAAGEITIGTLASFQVLFLNLAFSLSYAMQYMPTLLQAAGSIQRIDELLAEQPNVADRPGAKPLPPLAHGIAFEHVSFGYQAHEPRLHDISLHIPAQGSAAFVGTSGSGKSTILNLILRLYEPDSGRVTFDSVDLREATQHSLRAQMSVVFQDSFLFNISAADNIRMSKLDATPREIEEAARAAEIHDTIIELPQGYDTPLGERGGRLSGGQRQRIAIARAILRDPRILVLDEATSALDPESEAAINATLARVGQGRMVVSVTHRLTSASHADRIFVLDHGRLVEFGSHRDLLARHAHYWRLWNKQSGFAVTSDGYHASIDPERLAALPVFDQLDAEMLTEAARLFTTEQVPDGRTIIHEGERGDRFHVIVRGSVEVLKRIEGAAPAAGGEPQRRLAVLQVGDHFGELALLRHIPRTASIRTMTPCTLLTLASDQFDYLVGRVPQLRARMEQMHAARLNSGASLELRSVI